MKKYVFIEYPKCSTCQKAKKWLEENNIDFQDRHIVTECPTEKELTEWINRSGLDIKKFFNTSGMLYREMGLSEKMQSLSEEEKIRLLASNGMLIKRPLVIGKDKILVGFKVKEWEEKLK
ncbi:MAG: arsenate reductase family protein [Clostridia bacterium]